jgi:2-dehydro-3-deoxyphosphooctonate aldolase (KDO 8-P synthase)
MDPANTSHAPAGAPATQTVRVGDVAFGSRHPLALIAGPCVIEGRDHALRHAAGIADVCRALRLPYVFKSSYDKANRSSGRSFRGLGMEDGLRILADVRSEVGVPVLTDVHDEEQARMAGEVVDCVQVPAFLCRQTDLLVAAARTGKAVNVKKGQFLAPEDVANLVAKVKDAGNAGVLVTERGVTFGYRALVVDYTGFATMRATGQPLIFDATHAVQVPGGRGHASGGDRTKVPPLARAAVACGVDGLFLEVHEDPDHAPSDGPNMLVLGQLRPLLETLLRIDAAAWPDRPRP